MVPTCGWCGKPDAKYGEFNVCNPECEAKLKRAGRLVQVKSVYFAAGLVLYIVLAVAMVWLMRNSDAGGPASFFILASIGVVLIMYPFVMPEAIEKLGARKAAVLGRLIGVLSILGGIGAWIGLGLG